MLKPDLEKLIERYRDSAKFAVLHGRDDKTGCCRMCKVGRGAQHKKSCHLWPLIDVRIEHGMMESQALPETETAKG